MRVLPVLVMVGLLVLPGCTSFEGFEEQSESEELLEPEIELVQGCTDPEANNYDETAEEDDGSCEYDEPEPILGCTDPTADNYNPEAD
ncbi:MAG: hypothetical protein CMP10_08800, partial [Zetaproteobacteria bacterium]|nr:hypothetical protein [Pseudobdellovibrionaceae bacterium]